MTVSLLEFVNSIVIEGGIFLQEFQWIVLTQVNLLSSKIDGSLIIVFEGDFPRIMDKGCVKIFHLKCLTRLFGAHCARISRSAAKG